MAINYSYPSGAPTDNAYLNSLIWGGSLAAGNGLATTITWSAGGSEYAYFESTRVWTEAWTTTELAALQNALQQLANVCNITFTQVSDANSSDLREFKITSASMRLATGASNVVASHEVPGDSQYAVPLYGFYNDGLAEWTSGLQQGSAGFKAMMHELAHGLGLAHPHDGGSRGDATVFPGVTAGTTFGDYGDNDLNQGIWTIMSYNDGWLTQPTSGNTYGSEGTPMAFDIAALQYIYGANTTYQTGSNTYTLPSSNASGTFWSCIWDAGGTDGISAEGVATSCTINLNDAPLTGANAAGYVSYISGITGGFTIANGVTVENATGGSGNDTLVGNEVANILTGGGGNDTLTGGDGNDIFVFATSGNGTDTITDLAVGDIIRIGSSSFTQMLSDGDGSSLGLNQMQLASSDGATWLYLGTDSIAGADVAIRISAALSANRFKLSGSDISLIAQLTGSSGKDKLTGTDADESLSGGAGNDTLDGGAGNDTLDGGAGNDKLIGGTGDDTFYVDAKGDVIKEKAGEGIDTIISSISYTLGSTLENLTLDSTAYKGVGNSGNNVMVGNDGSNKIYGKFGNDTLTGGGASNPDFGTDIFVFDTKLDASNNVDTITDFVSSDGVVNLNGTCALYLSKSIFTAYRSTKAGTAVSSVDFVAENNATAHDSSDHFLYDTSSGNLYYDADGSGTAKSAILFATLTGAPTLAAGDLFIV